jgi:hypothetical protein
MPSRDVLRELFKTHIQSTGPEAVVSETTVLLCGLTNVVRNALGCHTAKVYATSRFLKHLYDKKPAEEFDALLGNVHKVVKYPDRIYQNKPGKRGAYCLTKRIGNLEYLAALEINKEIFLATAFRVRDKKYLDDYELLWSWRDGGPSS